MKKINEKETTVYDEKSLLNELYIVMDDLAYSEIIVVAGHFMLFYDPSNMRLIPGIFEDVENKALREQIKKRVGIFPSYTWDLGIRVGEHYLSKANRTAKLLLLINDWQYVPDSGTASDYRQDFYEEFKELPTNFRSRLKESKVISETDIFSSQRNPYAFPETWLKNRFQNEATRLVKAGKLQKRFLTDKPGMSEISFTDTLGNSLPLISCGMTGCAGEITEMISEVYKAGGRLLIIFAPAECHIPIRTGVEIALSIYELTNIKVVVIDLGGNGEMTHEDIYDRGVSIVSYEA